MLLFNSAFNALSFLHFIPYLIGISSRKLPINTNPHMNVNVPPTVIDVFIFAKQPIKIALSVHLMKLKQLVAVEDLQGDTRSY